MRDKINDKNLLSYFKIVDKELDDILDIFVRVNSGGTILSKSDLLFSTLVAHWEDGRDKIEKLISQINGEDGCFDFNTDFLMRTCLFLVDAPMSFKIKTFDKKNIDKIRENWEQISSALIETSRLLRDFGFNKSRLSSSYAATPVAYYIIKGGLINERTKQELRKFVVRSLLKQIYSGQADTVLSGLREGLREKDEKTSKFQLKNQYFSFDDIKQTKLSGNKRLTVDHEDINDFLDQKKGAFSFLILSVLYPDLKIGQIIFHQDHMHPYSKFSKSNLSDLENQGVDVKQWLDMRDKIPNLQLLEGTENTKKQATHLKDWIAGNEENEAYYRKRNYISENQDLSFQEFTSFYDSRARLIRSKLEDELLC